jgi:hypothetical protein
MRGKSYGRNNQTATEKLGKTRGREAGGDVSCVLLCRLMVHSTVVGKLMSFFTLPLLVTRLEKVRENIEKKEEEEIVRTMRFGGRVGSMTKSREGAEMESTTSRIEVHLLE